MNGLGDDGDTTRAADVAADGVAGVGAEVGGPGDSSERLSQLVVVLSGANVCQQGGGRGDIGGGR